MTRQLFRSFAAITLAGVITLAPVAQAFGQGQAQAPPPTATPAQPQGGQPSQTPAVPVPVVPFQFERGRDYSVPPSWWYRNVRTPYRPSEVTMPQLTNSPRIDQLVKDGKLMLSLQDAVELALENNLDIQVQRYYPWMAETDLLRTAGGGGGRGVANTTLPGVFTNQPGLNFDPTLTGLLSVDSRDFPVNNPLTSGTGVSGGSGGLFTHTETGDFAYNQAFHTGTSFSASLNTVRTSTTSSAVRFNPSVQEVGAFTLTQPLLNGFGSVNK